MDGAISALTLCVPLAVKSLEGNRLAPRGCLVRVRCGTDQNSPTERWFAVGSYPQRSAEVAVRNLPQIEWTNVASARRPKRAENRNAEAPARASRGMQGQQRRHSICLSYGGR